MLKERQPTCLNLTGNTSRSDLTRLREHAKIETGSPTFGLWFDRVRSTLYIRVRPKFSGNWVGYFHLGLGSIQGVGGGGDTIQLGKLLKMSGRKKNKISGQTAMHFPSF